MKDRYSDEHCARGVIIERGEDGELNVTSSGSCCKLSLFDWMEGVPTPPDSAIFEVRFKNTRKHFFKNESGERLSIGDLVVVEATNGTDLGVVSLGGAVIFSQLKRNRIDIEEYQFKRIFRKARPNDIEKWQEAISREYSTMIRARQVAAMLNLDMKIGDVEFQGDGTKAIFYYIADERVDFRELIKIFAEEFRIRIEMKQIGARQEAGLIGGIGVCGQELCCSRFMADFKSITTQVARSQDLSLNPQKLAGQCGKLKCCINYEAALYLDAQKRMPYINEPLKTEEGPLYLVKRDVLKGIMWFSYVENSMNNMFPLPIKEVKEIIALNHKGVVATNVGVAKESTTPEFKSAAGEESISRFDKREEGRRGKRRGRSNRQGSNRRRKNHNNRKGRGEE